MVTINLPYVAYEAAEEGKDFWELLDERLELCHKALKCRYMRLKDSPVTTSPIHWVYGGLARLNSDQVIGDKMFDNYATISLGFAGLWECVEKYSGFKLTDPKGKAIGIEIMTRLNEKCEQWKKEESISYSVYGTPLESTTLKFARALHKFGYKYNYITNSYHVNVREQISAFDKLDFESEFQKLSPGGAISYIESPNAVKNPESILEVIKYIYNNIMYAEVNLKIDLCNVCGYNGEIHTEKIDGKLTWKCPCCGNTDEKKMTILRRTCGYLGSNYFNQGRTAEIEDRVEHLCQTENYVGE